MKKKHFSRFLSLLLIALMLLPNFGMVAQGAETPELEIKNVEFEEEWSNGESKTAPDGAPLSYKEAPYVDTSFVDEVDSGSIEPVRGILPASYSSSSYLPMYTSSNYMLFEQQKDVVTPIKNQSPYGTCWAHAAISVAESSYIMNYGLVSNAVDFNEYQHVWYGYNPVYDELGLYGGDYNEKNPEYYYRNILDLGGNNLISMMMFANWTGVSAASESVFDADDVLSGNIPNDSFAYDDFAHLENAYVLTIPNYDYYYSYEDMKVDMDIVKQAIRDYGSVTVSYYAQPGSTYDSEYFQCITRPGWLEWRDGGTNHAVTVVGWNDNIPASAFPNGADGNGAWLIKNSWGSGYGFDGYFWLSYYDRSIGMNAIAMDFANEDNYDNNYHYDGTGNYFPALGYGTDYIYGGNAFVADSAETLEAVGLVTGDVNYDYTIYVYTDVAPGANPTTGTLATTQSGTLTYAGVHTVDLDQSVSLDAGERYGIVVCYEKPGYEVAMSVDYTSSWGWVDFYSFSNAGESYMGTRLNSMSDLYYSDYAGNVRVKAFTNEGHDGGSSVAGWINDGYGWKYQKSDGTYVTNCWYMIDGQWYAFNEYSYMREGWFLDGGSWYYLTYGNGTMHKGWLQEGGSWYYFADSGKMVIGWIGIGGTWYYMHSSGAMATGWVQDGGSWYYMNGSGAMATGWVQDGGTWYYMNGNGAMTTGWVQDGGTWYYMNSNGAMATGWVLDGGTWYYMHGNGKMATGWVLDGGNWYYMHGSGKMATGWILDGGNWYYLYDNGVMARNTWIDGCYVDDNGVWVY